MSQEKKRIIEGVVDTYFDEGTFTEINGKTLLEILVEMNAVELQENFIKPNKGKKKIRLTVEVLD